MMNKITVILGTAHLLSTLGKCSPDAAKGLIDSPYYLKEWEYSRRVCRALKDRLISAGVNCIIDWEEDDMPGVSPSQELARRVSIVNKICAEKGCKNCVYVSVHLNAASNGKWSDARGLAVYACPSGSTESKRLARLMYDEGDAHGLSGNRSVPAARFWTANFYVLKNTRCPAVLSENLFQDNRDDVLFLKSKEGFDAIVDYHFKAIMKYIA